MLSVMYLVPLLVARAVAADGASSLGPVVLLPARFEARAGETLQVRLRDGADAGLAWGDHPTTWTFVRAAGTQENRDTLPGADAKDPAGAASIPLTTPGATMIGVEFAPRTVRMSREDLDRALQALVTDADRQKVLDAAPQGKPLSVRVTAGAKSLIRVLTPEGTAPATDAQTPGSKSGQFNEIRVLLDPLASLVGGDISVRFHADYDKAAKARASATNLDSGKAQPLTSDASGIALFHMDEPGPWRVTFTTARPAPKGDNVDVIVYSGSLTFAATRTEVSK
jgi:hypothetical protein